MLFLLGLLFLAASGLAKRRHKIWGMVLQFLAAISVGLHLIDGGEKGLAIVVFGIGLLYLAIGIFLYRRSKVANV